LVVWIPFFPCDAAAQRGIGPPLFRDFTITLRYTHSVRLLWTNDQLVAETSTWQHTTLTTNRHPCTRWYSNPQF